MIPSLDIIIVNWNAGKQLYECINSIIAADREGFKLQRVVIVDNASSDGSIDCLKNLDLPLEIIQNLTNRGFAAACNQGSEHSQADYLLFLNPDTRLFKNSLIKPIQFMENPTNTHIGICGIQLLDENGVVNRHCCYFPNPRKLFNKILGLNYISLKHFSSYTMVEWEHSTNRKVDHVIGAFYLVRRKLFESLNKFDERFFVYWEDMDFSYRAYQAGWYCYYLADATAFHKGNGTSEQIKAKRLFYSWRSRILYSYKHFSWGTATGLSMATLILEPLARLGLAAITFSWRQIQETLEASFRLWIYILQKFFQNEAI